MTIEELKRRKKELGYTNQEIADLSGVPLSTVQKIFSGATTSPRYDSLQALEKLLRGTSCVKETSTAWGISAQDDPAPDTGQIQDKGESGIPAGDGYTYSDYIALPDDLRVELIDGRFYDMAAPNSRHQIIIGQLYTQLDGCARTHPGCMALLSPMDVMLDGDDRTVVQPDIMLLCDRSKMRKGRIFGAPDLVMEVISPAYRKKDYVQKASKYMVAGVREYWIVDYQRLKVVVYINDYGEGVPNGLTGEPAETNSTDSRQEMDVNIYGMDGDIPIFISDGSCVIHMGEIRQLLDSLGDI